MKSVVINDMQIDPLGSEREESACPACSRNVARWDIEGVGLRCSACILHVELADQKEAVDGLISAVELNIGRKFVRSEEGLLEHGPDADRIVAGIVITQRMEWARRARL